jgi:hypothetical protein
MRARWAQTPQVRFKVVAMLITSGVLAASALSVAPTRATEHAGYEIHRLRPIADATVVASRPRMNFGGAPWLRVRADESRSYLKFRLPPHMERRELETLEVWMTSPTGDGCEESYWPTDLLRSSNDWKENTITWANAPTPFGWEGSAAYVLDRSVLFETSPDLAAGRIVSFVLEMPEGCTVLHSTRYGSSEQPTGRPYAEVWFTRLEK